jgi:hypothetical protein
MVKTPAWGDDVVVHSGAPGVVAFSRALEDGRWYDAQLPP